VPVEVTFVDKLVMPGETLACIYARRFTGFDANPKLVTPRDVVTVTGKLEYHATPLCWWSPAGGDDVELYVDGVKRSTAKTESDGTFKFSIPASELGLGRHVVYCVAPEFWRGCYAKSSEVVVEVVTEEEKRSRETQQLLLYVGIGAAVAIAIAGVAAALHQREQLMTMMALMARRK
jgi:hypothetical protein